MWVIETCVCFHSFKLDLDTQMDERSAEHILSVLHVDLSMLARVCGTRFGIG